MGYSLTAFAGRAEELAGWNVPVSRLTQGFALAPVTEELFDELRERLELHGDPIESWGLRASKSCKLAYLDGEFFGGRGGWSCRTFENGLTVATEADVNEALQFLGVAVEEGDAFDAVGLGRFRHTESWAAEAITDRLVDLDDPVPGWLEALAMCRPSPELQSKVRSRAARALGHLILDDEQLGRLERVAVADPDYGVRLDATLALGSLGALAALERLLDQGDRWPALHALGKMGSRAARVVPRLEPLLRDPDWKVRLEAVRVLAEMEELAEETTTRLVRLLQDPERLVRSQVAQVLGGLMDFSPEAQQRLRAAVSDPCPEVWAAVREVLLRRFPAIWVTRSTCKTRL